MFYFAPYGGKKPKLTLRHNYSKLLKYQKQTSLFCLNVASKLQKLLAFRDNNLLDTDI